MSYKVITPFRDKTDYLKRYKKGDSYSHKDEKRVAFLVKQGYIAENKSKQKKDEKEDA